METQKSTKGTYIRKTYPWQSTDKPPAIRIKSWVATIIKDIGESNPIMLQWVRWIHNFGGKTHCFSCLRLHGCLFNRANMPMLPLHDNCHCTVEEIPYAEVLALTKVESNFKKFDPYLFDPHDFYKHKKNLLFEKWGYTIKDAKWLQHEIEQQGREKYISGDYTLGRLDHNGQRISIRVTIPRNDCDETVSFITGWMLYPNGQVKLNTPYGGR